MTKAFVPSRGSQFVYELVRVRGRVRVRIRVRVRVRVRSRSSGDPYLSGSRK